MPPPLKTRGPNLGYRQRAPGYTAYAEASIIRSRRSLFCGAVSSPFVYHNQAVTSWIVTRERLGATARYLINNLWTNLSVIESVTLSQLLDNLGIKASHLISFHPHLQTFHHARCHLRSGSSVPLHKLHSRGMYE